MRVTIIGTGFVGVVTAAVLASFGNTVVGLDIDEKKVASLKSGRVPFFEPGLEELLKQELASGRVTFTTHVGEAITDAEVVMIAVGTPSDAQDHANLQYLYAACDSLAPFLSPGAVVVVKSTVPPGTLETVTARIAAKTQTKFATASVPEFLSEGTAVQDTLHPDRVVIGVDDEASYQRLAELHAPLKAPIVRVSAESAQMGKYAANAYLALRIAFINQVADLCEHNGADIQDVIAVIGKDARIGAHYWYPGLGYGGSCFPKDVKELAYYSKSVGADNNLFVELNRLNERRITDVLEQFASAVGGWNGKKVAVLGLSFKPNTNDTREAPALRVIPQLLAAGATVFGFDPQATKEAAAQLATHPELSFSDSIEAAVANSDVILLLTEWPEIVQFAYNTTRVADKKQWILDARNQLDPAVVRSWGFMYQGIGRGKGQNA